MPPLVPGHRPQFLHQHIQMHRVAEPVGEAEMAVERARRVVLRMHDQRPDSGNVGGLNRAQDRVFQQARADAFAVPIPVGGKTGEDHDWHGMLREALAKPWRRGGVADLADDKRVKANNVIARQRHIGLRGIGLLVLQGIADKETVERLGPAVKGFHLMQP
jgi:hypothetical protein